MLKEGDVIEIKEGRTVRADVPEHFVFSNRKGCYDLTRSYFKIEGELAYFAGKYIAVKTNMGGGGMAHGSHDTYSEGHRVWCIKVDDRNMKIDFYQSGDFTSVLEGLEPIGKARLEWVIEN